MRTAIVGLVLAAAVPSLLTGSIVSAQAQQAIANVDVAPFVASEVAPRVHLLSTPDDYFGPVVGNVTLIEQSDGFVIIDSGLTAANGRAVVRYARSLASKPIKAVAITHWHNDHPQGVSAIRDAFPNVRIIATSATEAGMLGPEAVAVGFRPDPKIDAELKKLVDQSREASQKLLADPSVPADRRARIEKSLLDLDRFHAGYSGTYIVPPTETFERELLLDDADYPVHLMHFGRANTDGDLVAWLPKQKIVASGDIVVSPIPFGFGSYPGDWVETMGKLKALGFTTLIPGHGEPQPDASYLDRVMAMIGEIRAQVAPLAKEGMPLDEVKKKVDFTRAAEAFSDVPRIRTNIKSLFFDPMVQSAYKEALGQPIVQGEGSPVPEYRHTPPKPSSKKHKS